MNYTVNENAVENLLGEIRLKTPKIQSLIGAGAGIVAAIGFFNFTSRFFFVWYE